MTTKTSDRAAFWRHHRENFRTSGLSRSAYCREHGLKRHQLAYQLDRVGKSVAADKTAFARVVTAAPVAATKKSAARLYFGDSVALELEAGSDPAWIAQVITALGGGQ